MSYETKIDIHGTSLSLQTGKIACQAESAVWAQIGGTILLVTVATQKLPHPSKDMVPLSVHYLAPFYASGRFPGGFNKRETKPSDAEVIEARLIDRAIRPLFPHGLDHEVQIVVKCFSYDGVHEPSSIAITATSAALRLSSIPFKKAIAAVRVGQSILNGTPGEWILNPSHEALKDSPLDFMIAGSEDAVLMVECGAHEHTEDQILDALFWGQQHIQSIVQQVEQWTQSIQKPKATYTPTQAPYVSKIQSWLAPFLTRAQEALAQSKSKIERNAILTSLKEEAMSQAESLLAEWENPPLHEVGDIFKAMVYEACRQSILEQHRRVDGRSPLEIRPISSEVTLLPHAHGSALFTRGETQALVTTTLGSDRDAQMTDGIHGDLKERFMLHYHFPPYSVGECGPMGAPKRREIGHGRLARRALLPMMPSDDQFPYVLRIASDITACNGSSSMATVCGASLSLFDAGVPMKRAVAGIAMGLIKDQDRFVILSDILGDEDAYGDMDFKVAGTEQGITALQMDIKVDGVNRAVLETALKQAREGRMHILSEMQKTLSQPKEQVADHAPKVIMFKIKPDKIRDVIGKGGSVIKELCERYQITIDISEAGQVKIGATHGAKGEEAKQHILGIAKDIEVGELYHGTVSKIMDFGAFITLMPGKDGFLHISEISDQRIADINDHLKRGQKLHVKVLEIDHQQRVRLSMRNIDQA